MLSYWQRARRWARENTKTFTPLKAAPSILAAVVQYRLLHLHPLIETVVVAATILAVYICLHALDYFWKLLIKAPVVLDNERLAEIKEEERARLQSEAYAQTLLSENVESKKAVRPRAQQVVFDQAKSELGKLGSSERDLLIALLKRDEMKYEELK